MKALPVLLASLLAVPLPAAAQVRSSPTPIPGGANQAAGVEGPFGAKLFNGQVRLVAQTLREATAADGFTAGPGTRWVAFTATASNGTKQALSMTQFIASIVDASGNTIQAQPDKVRPVGGLYGVPPGGAWKEEVFFEIPAGFTPQKIVLAPYDGKRPVFRITVRPQDLPPAAGGGTRG